MYLQIHNRANQCRIKYLSHLSQYRKEAFILQVHNTSVVVPHLMLHKPLILILEPYTAHWFAILLFLSKNSIFYSFYLRKIPLFVLVLVSIFYLFIYVLNLLVYCVIASNIIVYMLIQQTGVHYYMCNDIVFSGRIKFQITFLLYTNRNFNMAFFLFLLHLFFKKKRRIQFRRWKHKKGVCVCVGI